MKSRWLLAGLMLIALCGEPWTQNSSRSSASQGAAPQTTDTSSNDVQIKQDPAESKLCNLSVSNQFTLERQASIGQTVAQQIESNAKFVNDPVITEYMNRITQKLARNSTAKIPLTTRIIDSDAVNALAVPDGSLFINSGLILAADEEAELAGALAHEIAHIAGCHGARAWSSMERGPAYPWLAEIPKTGGIDSAGGMYGIARFSRAYEAQADYLGIEYMYRAGYDPSGLVRFFAKVNEMQKAPWKLGTVASAFVTHPQNANRIDKSESQIRSMPDKVELLVTGSEFGQVKARLLANCSRDNAKVTSAERPEQGSTK